MNALGRSGFGLVMSVSYPVEPRQVRAGVASGGATLQKLYRHGPSVVRHHLPQLLEEVLDEECPERWPTRHMRGADSLPSPPTFVRTRAITTPESPVRTISSRGSTIVKVRFDTFEFP